MELHVTMQPRHWQVVLLLGWSVLYSQTPAHAQILNLYQAVNRATTNYPLLQIRQQQVAAGEAHINTINDNRLPSLRIMEEATAGTSNSVAGGYFPLSTIPSVSGSIRPDNRSEATAGNVAIGYVDWPVYTFGYYTAQKKQATAELQVSKAALNTDEYNLVQTMLSLYLDWLKKYQLLGVENENMQRAKKIFDAVNADVVSGLKPGVDSSTASAEYAKSRIAYLQAQNNYMYDQLAIASYTGMDSADIKPDTTMALNNAAAIPADIAQENIVPDAHPVLNYFEKQVELQNSFGKTIAKKYLPKLSFEGAAWMRGSGISPKDEYATNFTDGLAYSKYNYLVGFALSYNLLDIKRRHDELKENSYQTEARKKVLETQQMALNRSLQQANYAYRNTLEKLQELPMQLSAAQMAYNQQDALYKAGLNTLVDVTNALYALKQTNTDYILAQNDLLQLMFIRAGLTNQLDTFLQKFK